MKKIVVLLIISLSLFACSSNETTKSVTCSLIENTEDTGMDVDYIYNQDNEIVKVKNVTYATFSQEKLNEKSLESYYNDVENDYKDLMNAKGVSIDINKNEDKKVITLKVIVDLKEYDYDKDLFSIGTKDDYADVKKVIKELNTYGMYNCGKVK